MFKPQQAVKKETLHIALGTLALCAVMLVCFALAGQFSWQALAGTLLGGGWAALNFFLLGISVQQAAAKSDKAKNIMQFSYSLRMLATALVLIAGFALPVFHWLAVLLPQLFPRITILILQLTGHYKPDAPSQAERGEE